MTEKTHLMFDIEKEEEKIKTFGLHFILIYHVFFLNIQVHRSKRVDIDPILAGFLLIVLPMP